MKAMLNTDGGARGNPGPAAIGVVIRDESGNILNEFGKRIGVGTNNEAEYKALVYGLNALKKLDIDSCVCNLDSELVVKQLNGQYKVKEPRMRILYDEVKELAKGFVEINFVHVPRKDNSHADKLVNEALDANS